MDLYTTDNSYTAYSILIRDTKDIWMMPVVKNQKHFDHWAASYPFYSNVQKEGVVLYEAA